MEYDKVAAKWWADKLRKVVPRNYDIGDTSSTGGMVMLLASVLAMNSQPSDKAINLFEERLADTIKKHVEDNCSMTLSVDYGPDYILDKLAQETGVSANRFPKKTTMWIKKDKVSVSVGYAAPRQTIFPE